jgi:hypothetical protein
MFVQSNLCRHVIWCIILISIRKVLVTTGPELKFERIQIGVDTARGDSNARPVAKDGKGVGSAPKLRLSEGGRGVRRWRRQPFLTVGGGMAQQGAAG